MKNRFLTFIIVAVGLFGLPAFSQTEEDVKLLGLPGDNLDLYAVLTLFQKSKTIEEFEKTLNLKETGINNLDLNLDEKVDFIKVTTKQKDDDFSFILQVDVSEKEIQDVAVILLDKDKDGKMTLQIVGDKDLYGKDYVIEPKTTPTPAVTANPAYSGTEPAPVSVPASTTVVVVETVPVVQYVYSPVYVPYYPPYYYAYYPPYYSPYAAMAVHSYHYNCYHYHGAYYGGNYGGGNTVVINNQNNYNYYNNSRNTSNTVNQYNKNGNYNTSNAAATNRATGGSSSGNRATTSPSTNQTKAGQPSAAPSVNRSKGTSNSTRPSTTTRSTGTRSSGASRPSGGGGGSRWR